MYQYKSQYWLKWDPSTSIALDKHWIIGWEAQIATYSQDLRNIARLLYYQISTQFYYISRSSATHSTHRKLFSLDTVTSLINWLCCYSIYLIWFIEKCCYTHINIYLETIIFQLKLLFYLFTCVEQFSWPWNAINFSDKATRLQGGFNQQTTPQAPWVQVF